MIVPLHDFDACYRCGSPLSEAEVVRQGNRLIRSGPFMGKRGTWKELRCACGRELRVLWSVFVPDEAA